MSLAENNAGVSDQCHLKRMDDDTQSTRADCITTDLTVEVPPVEATVCAVNKEKTTKKARRKANKDQADAVWKVCVPNVDSSGMCRPERQRHRQNLDMSDLPYTASPGATTTGPIVRAGVDACSPRGIQQATRCPRGRATKGDERTL